MKLKVNFFSQFKMLADLIFISLPCFLFIFLGWNSFEMGLIIILLIPYFLMFFFPVIILHLNYLKQCNGAVYEIEYNEIVKKDSTGVLKYCIEDIDEIIFCMNATRKRGYGGLAHSNYYYAKIKFNNGSNFIISSLYSSKIDKILQENFPNVKITTEKVFYPMI